MLLSPVEVIQFWGWSGLLLAVCAFLGCIGGLAVYYVLIRNVLQTPKLRDKEAEKELKATIVGLKARLLDATDFIDVMKHKNDDLERRLAHAKQMAGVIAEGA